MKIQLTKNRLINIIKAEPLAAGVFLASADEFVIKKNFPQRIVVDINSFKRAEKKR
jgi:hypothetical protein